ncbi:MAG: TauD/TfdA dioxygenase family protein [Alphaproteobacteria bacterium]|tara:strand:+ start:865 stop:1710 length:846 start_codon:yes stop_codon:yes gene_type:complete
MTNYEINSLTPTIGAEISGIDLSNNLNSQDLDSIYKNLIDHKVIFFRNQNLKPEDHVAFAKSFGDIEPPHPIYPHVENFPEITLLENDPTNPPDTDEWHTDVTFKTEPPFTSILYSKEIPPSGGDTLWCSLIAIYEALPENIKIELESKRAIHDMGAFRNNFSSENNEEYSKKLNDGFKKFGNAVHPVVKVHPILNKKFLYINPSFTRHIIGMDMTDSNNLLSYLFNFMTKPQYQVRFKWTPNTLALWDNRCTMHYAIGDYMPHRRVMNRITVLNDKRDVS